MDVMYTAKGKGSGKNSYGDGCDYLNGMMMGFSTVGPSSSSFDPFDHSVNQTMNARSNISGHLNEQNLEGVFERGLCDKLYKMHIGNGAGDYGTLGSNESEDLWLNRALAGRQAYNANESYIPASPYRDLRFQQDRMDHMLGMSKRLERGYQCGKTEFQNPFAMNGPSFGALSQSQTFQKINLGLGLNMNKASGGGVAEDSLLSQFRTSQLMKSRQLWSSAYDCSASRDFETVDYKQNLIPQEEILEYYANDCEGSYGDSLGNVQDYICNIAKNQIGCRILQRAFDQGTSQDVQLIFNGIIDRVVEFMLDQFGNYLVQKLLIFCNDEQRMQIVLRVTREPGQLLRISLDTHGTRVVQKLIETIKNKLQISLVIEALQPGFLDLATDLNGNHVLQRCLQSFSKEHNKFILNAAARYCFDIATHRYGCCVLNKCIGYATGKHRDKLLLSISFHALILAQDAFGNYVIQYIIELKNQGAASLLLSQFEGHFVHLSKQKFSSHVVEKCLKFIEESRPMIIHELVSVPQFEHLLQDPFANYVIQSALGVTKGSLRGLLVDAVRPHMSLLRSNPFCKKILSQNIFKKK